MHREQSKHSESCVFITTILTRPTEARWRLTWAFFLVKLITLLFLLFLLSIRYPLLLLHQLMQHYSFTFILLFIGNFKVQIWWNYRSDISKLHLLYQENYLQTNYPLCRMAGSYLSVIILYIYNIIIIITDELTYKQYFNVVAGLDGANFIYC